MCPADEAPLRLVVAEPVSAASRWQEPDAGERARRAAAGRRSRGGRGSAARTRAPARSVRPVWTTSGPGRTGGRPAATLAAKLATLTPGDLDYTLYAVSGAEANERSVQIARHYWLQVGRPRKYKIIALQGGYHGGTIGTFGATACIAVA